MNVLVVGPYMYDTAPGQRFRIEQWARLLEKQGVTFTFAPFATPRLQTIMYQRGRVAWKMVEGLRGLVGRLRLLRDLSRFDVAFLYREAAPIGPAMIEQVIARRVPIVYDFDDAIYLPTVSDANRVFARLKCVSKVQRICALSEHVTVGNHCLRRFAAEHARRVSVIPTTIDIERHVLRKILRPDGVVVLGWMGSETTLPHLTLIHEPLRRLAARRRFVLHVVSTRDVSIEGVQVKSTRWSSAREVDDLQSFDIGLMPLPDDAWTRRKCGGKLLLYMAVGVPGVASPVGVNADIVEDGASGYLANTAAEWVDKLAALIDSPALRASMGAVARRTIETRFSAQVVAPRVLDILHRSRDG